MKEAQIKKYIELVYSQESELNKIQNLSDRKKKAIEIVDGKIDSAVCRDIMALKSKDINTMIFDYIKSNNSNKYALLISRQQLFWELQERLMKPLTSNYKNGDNVNIDIDDEALLKAVNLKTTISDKAEVLIEGIDRLYEHIFIAKEEIDMATQIIKFSRPEDRLKKKTA